MSGQADQEPDTDISTWTIERLEAYAATQHGQVLEEIRELAQSHAYFDQEPKHVRLRWAKLSLNANTRLHARSPGSWGRNRMAQRLRTGQAFQRSG